MPRPTLHVGVLQINSGIRRLPGGSAQKRERALQAAIALPERFATVIQCSHECLQEAREAAVHWKLRADSPYAQDMLMRLALKPKLISSACLD